MEESITDKLRKMAEHLPKPQPYEPTPFVVGVAHELRAIADQLESGAMFINRFSLRSEEDKEILEIEAGELKSRV